MELSIAMNESQWLLFQDPHKGEIKPNNRKWDNKSRSKKCPEVEVSKMLDQLLELNVIELSEMKRHEEARKVNDLNYYKYHCLVSHPT